MAKTSWAVVLIVLCAISICTAAQTPSSALDLLKRGNTALSAGDWENAVKDFTIAIYLNSGYQSVPENSKSADDEDCANIATSDDFNAFAFNNRGIAHYRHGDLEKSIADFERALRINPRLADAYNNRGNVWHAKGVLEKALPDFDQAIKLNPRHSRAFNNRANLRLSIGDLKGAINDYNRSIELDSTNATAFANRGLTYLRLGQNKEARLDFDAATKLDPTLKKKLEELIHQERTIN